MAKLPELMKELGTIRAKKDAIYHEFEQWRGREQELREVIMAELQAAGLKSAKSDDYTASIATKPRIRLRDERAAIDWLQNTPNVEADHYIGIKMTMFEPLALTALKETGEIVPGTELENNEYLSVRKAAKK